MHRRHAVTRSTALLALGCLALAGCHRSAPAPAAPQAPPPPPRVSEIDLKTYKPNEAGAIMIVMYHRFTSKAPDNALNRTPETFRQDLQSLYDAGYRPVNVSDIVKGNIDLPAGKTPIALTFDDSLVSQFRVVTGTDGQAHIDPECAIGIMESFSKAHPDWQMKGTFFVLPEEGRQGPPFGQKDFVDVKLGYLAKHGYEIGNHTANHISMRRSGADQIRQAIAVAQKDIVQIAPSAAVTSLAVPFGEVPRKDAKDSQQALISGEYNGTRYENQAVVLAAWRPIMSPFTKVKTGAGGTIRGYNPYRLERIEPNPTKATQAGTLEFWTKYFQDNKSQRYVSDGNPKVVAVPKAYASLVDAAKVRSMGKELQIYSFSGGGGGSTQGVGGDSLSVQ